MGTAVGSFGRVTSALSFDGELFVVSRLKDLIIVRGRNFYPEDLEPTVVASHPLLRHHCCAVVPIEHEDGERVGVIVEVSNRQAR